MDKHITDIDIFEFSNDLIQDKTQVQKIENHISTCPDCMAKITAEKSITASFKSNLEVNQTIDVSEKVMNHFAVQPELSLIDNKWMVYVILTLFGFLAILQIANTSFTDSISGFTIPHLHYIKLIISATVSILFIDLISKYLKQKKFTSLS